MSTAFEDDPYSLRAAIERERIRSEAWADALTGEHAVDSCVRRENGGYGDNLKPELLARAIVELSDRIKALEARLDKVMGA